jgi:hypothetical protein
MWFEAMASVLTVYRPSDKEFEMGIESNLNEMAAYTPDPLKDLTVQDALIISAVYAVDAKTEKCKQIVAKAQNNPLFAEEAENTSARVNKYTNLMQGGNALKAVEAVTHHLEPQHRKQAFEFAMGAALTGEALTEDKKKTLRTLGEKLALDNQFVDQKLAAVE